MTQRTNSLNDPARIAALRETHLLDSAPEEPFDIFTRLAKKILVTPIALVSLVDTDRQFFKSCIGLPEPYASARETPLELSFCKHAVITGEPFIVEDAREHRMVKDNPVVAAGVIAYAGIPLITRDGHALGSLCVIDKKPRQWTDTQIDILKELAAAVVMEMEWRRDLDSSRNEVLTKNHFMAVLSHELRTPLAPALMTATMLAQNKQLPEPVREDIRLIQRNIELQTRLVDDLLDSTRIATGKLRLHLESLDIHQLLHRCVDNCAADASAKEISITQHLAAHAHYVNGDLGKLHQVFCNILKNAIKFTPQKGAISITSDNLPEDHIHIQITDTGIGVAPEHLSQIFNAFEQGDRQTTQSFGGLGLGLAICKGIVEAHDGNISAFSPGPTRGTTLSVRLALSTTPNPSSAASPSALPSAQHLRILLVDDHPDTLKAMTRLLSSLHHHVITAHSVESALKIAAENPFDILISDVGLTDGSGLDLMRQLSLHSPIPGIALTGYGMEADIEQTRQAGFARHLVKPVNFDALEKAIREVAAPQ